MTNFEIVSFELCPILIEYLLNITTMLITIRFGDFQRQLVRYDMMLYYSTVFQESSNNHVFLSNLLNIILRSSYTSYRLVLETGCINIWSNILY